MKGELKAGGLALVIYADNPEDIGKCVTLLHFVQPGELFTAPDGMACRWRENYPASWLVAGDIYADKGKEINGWGMFGTSSLMPIDDADPDAVDDRQKDKPLEVV